MSGELAARPCKVCAGPLLADEGSFYGQHMVDLSAPDPPSIVALSDPAKQMVARQRWACELGRARAVYAREAAPDNWIAAGTGMNEPYPCRCGEADEWQHAHGRCPCQGRTDTEHLPSTCCAHVQENVHDPEPAAPTFRESDEPPVSTLEELAPVLIDWELSQPRSRQTALGPSELGHPCLAQVIRKIAGYPRRELVVPSWAPFQGTAVHAAMELVIAHWNATIGRQRWIAEDELYCGEGIIGHSDVYDSDNGMVVDWKHTGDTALSKLLRAQRQGLPPAEQVSPEYRIQAHVYGAGHAAKGRDVRWVRLVLLARSWKYADSAEWTERYDPAIAAAALERYTRAKGLAAAMGLDGQSDLIATIPRTPHACQWCPFHHPTQPNNAAGCPGDETRVAAAIERFAEGLVTLTPSDVL